MPPTKRIGPLQEQVKRLDKELALAMGDARNKGAQIRDLTEKKERYLERIKELETALDNERQLRKDAEQDCLKSLKESSAELTLTRADFHRSNRLLIHQLEENAALRAALKAVL